MKKRSPEKQLLPFVSSVSPTACPPEAPTTCPPGMWFEERIGRPLPYLARWRMADGSKLSKGFASPAERVAFAAQWQKQRVKFGATVDYLSQKDIVTWKEFRDIVGDTHPLTVAREWKKLRGAGASDITVTKAVDAYLAFRYEGKLSGDTRRHFEKHLRERFVGKFGDMRLADVSADLITGWLKSLKHPRTGEPMDAVTRRHHRKDLNTFCDYATRVRGWLVRNPCDGVAVPHVDEEDVELLTPEEGRRLFAANEGNPVAGRMALEAFGFLRASSAGRLQLGDVRFATRGLRMPGAEHKSSKTKFRQGHPDNLWAWLNRAPDETWAMKWWEYRNEKAIAFRVAGIGGSDNRLRKTCISAHLAWLKNYPLTSYLAQHRHSSTTEIYAGVMEEEAGREWFQIGPRFP